MSGKKTTTICSFGIVLASLILISSTHHASAHCDAFDGPVIVEARIALEKGDVTPLLKWVPDEHESDIRRAFVQTLAVRSTGKEARELADRFFLETLVRIHRVGEGAPYTGLKAAGTIAPPIVAADKALAAGSVDELSSRIGNAVSEGIRKRFAEVAEKKKHANDSIEAGRAYVAAYVEYVHFVEGIHNIVSKGPAHDHAEP